MLPFQAPSQRTPGPPVFLIILLEKHLTNGLKRPKAVAEKTVGLPFLGSDQLTGAHITADINGLTTRRGSTNDTATEGDRELEDGCAREGPRSEFAEAVYLRGRGDGDGGRPTEAQTPPGRPGEAPARIPRRDEPGNLGARRDATRSAGARRRRGYAATRLHRDRSRREIKVG